MITTEICYKARKIETYSEENAFRLAVQRGKAVLSRCRFSGFRQICGAILRVISAILAAAIYTVCKWSIECC